MYLLPEQVRLYVWMIAHVFDYFVDMLGFKLEVPRREGSALDKVRPIYLDMQVSAEGATLECRL